MLAFPYLADEVQNISLPIRIIREQMTTFPASEERKILEEEQYKA